MAEVQWIKLYIDVFDKRKIKKLRRLPAGNDLLLIWVMLLVMAGKCNAGGMIFITESIPYTEEDLADELDFEADTISNALKAFQDLDMISYTDDGYINIIGWEEYQNTDKLAEIREQTRKRVAKSRENKRLRASNDECNVTVTLQKPLRNAIEEDKDKDIKKKKREERKVKESDCEQVAALYNSLCLSFPPLEIISDSIKTDLAESLGKYTEEQIKAAFKKAEASKFLKGENERKWVASFDWLIKAENIAKVLNGNFDNKKNKSSGKYDEFVNSLLQKNHNSESTTVTFDDDVK